LLLQIGGVKQLEWASDVLVHFVVASVDLKKKQFAGDDGVHVSDVGDDKAKELFRAITADKTATIKKLLAGGLDPNTYFQNDYGTLPAIVWAVYGPHEEAPFVLMRRART
jgi:hypothetical protein